MPDPNTAPDVSWDRLAKFVRQLSHDVRNGLNAIDLQATLVGELSSEEEVRKEATQLRNTVANLARTLQKTSGQFQAPSPQCIDFPADVLVAGLRERAEREFGQKLGDLHWKTDGLSAEPIILDFEMAVAVLVELLNNALHFRDAKAEMSLETRVESDGLHLVLTEAKTAPLPSDPAHWGSEPLTSSKRGGFGLGLHFVTRMIRSLNGRLERQMDDGQLVTRVVFPLHR